MSNNIITPTIVAKEALMILENNLVMPKLMYRGYEDEFTNGKNGYKTGASVSIRRPADFTVRRGAVAQVQDVVEGNIPVTVDQQVGCDFKFTSTELTLSIGELSERVIKPQLVQIANDIDRDCLSLYSSVPNWVGTPGQTINSFSDFYVGQERLNEFAVPVSDRSTVLSPSDQGGMLGSQTALYIQGPAGEAYRNAKLGMIGGADTYMAQNVATHTVGVATGTPRVNGASQNVTYDSVKASPTWSQTLNTDGWTNSTTGILKAGDIFTIANVFAVNPVTKATLPFLRQFTVLADANSGASTGPAALTISPPIITDGSQKTCSAVPADDALITVLGTGGTGYRQNLAFHKNAFAFVSVPMELPSGAVNPSRQSYKGLNVRVIPYYDGTNDVNTWRLDILYGRRLLDGRLATRQSGTA
jgi:hypothetical protein